jgi:hypothetical protein
VNWGAEDRAVDFENANQVFILMDELEKQVVYDDFVSSRTSPNDIIGL